MGAVGGVCARASLACICPSVVSRPRYGTVAETRLHVLPAAAPPPPGRPRAPHATPAAVRPPPALQSGARVGAKCVSQRTRSDVRRRRRRQRFRSETRVCSKLYKFVIRGQTAAEERQTAAVAHQLHFGTVDRVGTALRRDALSRRLHARRAVATPRALGGARSGLRSICSLLSLIPILGLVSEPKSQMSQARESTPQKYQNYHDTCFTRLSPADLLQHAPAESRVAPYLASPARLAPPEPLAFPTAELLAHYAHLASVWQPLGLSALLASRTKNSSIADLRSVTLGRLTSDPCLRLKAQKHAAALGLER